ncbi:MAG: hypothetical protein HUU20_16310 [Pirellulales bacterium]|nr:hypothetical protein [Pirellulales bacterium]
MPRTGFHERETLGPSTPITPNQPDTHGFADKPPNQQALLTDAVSIR